MKIAILGGGMSGMLAAKALWDNGIQDFNILTNSFSEPKGYMYLHNNCGMQLDGRTIKVNQLGEEEAYRKKLGYDTSVDASWKSDLEEYYSYGYNPYQAYEFLLWHFKDKAVDSEIRTQDIKRIKGEYDYIISTIPLPILYPDAQYYSSEIILEEFDTSKPYQKAYVYYDGIEQSDSIRFGIGFWGKGFAEYPVNQKVDGAVRVIKPIIATNVPKDNQIVLAGRTGQWNKSVLAHNAYYQILDKFKGGTYGG